MAQAGELAGSVRWRPGGVKHRAKREHHRGCTDLYIRRKLYGVWEDTLLATTPVQSASHFFAVGVCISLHDSAPPVSFCVFSSKFSPYFSVRPYCSTYPPSNLCGIPLSSTPYFVLDYVFLE